MQVIPGSHLLGPLRHEDLDDRKAVLPLRLADGRVDPQTARYLEMAAGAMTEYREATATYVDT